MNLFKKHVIATNYRNADEALPLLQDDGSHVCGAASGRRSNVGRHAVGSFRQGPSWTALHRSVHPTIYHLSQTALGQK